MGARLGTQFYSASAECGDAPVLVVAIAGVTEPAEEEDNDREDRDEKHVRASREKRKGID